MTIALELIKKTLQNEVAPENLDLVAGITHDHLLKGNDMQSVAAAIEESRIKYVALFAKQTSNSFQSAANTGEYNPWAKNSLSITQQVMIESREPSRAARLKSEAGL